MAKEEAEEKLNHDIFKEANNIDVCSHDNQENENLMSENSNIIQNLNDEDNSNEEDNDRIKEVNNSNNATREIKENISKNDSNKSMNEEIKTENIEKRKNIFIEMRNSFSGFFSRDTSTLQEILKFERDIQRNPKILEILKAGKNNKINLSSIHNVIKEEAEVELNHDVFNDSKAEEADKIINDSDDGDKSEKSRDDFSRYNTMLKEEYKNDRAIENNKIKKVWNSIENLKNLSLYSNENKNRSELADNSKQYRRIAESKLYEGFEEEAEVELNHDIFNDSKAEAADKIVNDSDDEDKDESEKSRSDFNRYNYMLKEEYRNDNTIEDNKIKQFWDSIQNLRNLFLYSNEDKSRSKLADTSKQYRRIAESKLYEDFDLLLEEEVEDLEEKDLKSEGAIKRNRRFEPKTFSRNRFDNLFEDEKISRKYDKNPLGLDYKDTDSDCSNKEIQNPFQFKKRSSRSYSVNEPESKNTEHGDYSTTHGKKIVSIWERVECSFSIQKKILKKFSVNEPESKNTVHDGNSNTHDKQIVNIWERIGCTIIHIDKDLSEVDNTSQKCRRIADSEICAGFDLLLEEEIEDLEEKEIKSEWANKRNRRFEPKSTLNQISNPSHCSESLCCKDIEVYPGKSKHKKVSDYEDEDSCPKITPIYKDSNKSKMNSVFEESSRESIVPDIRNPSEIKNSIGDSDQSIQKEVRRSKSKSSSDNSLSEEKKNTHSEDKECIKENETNNKGISFELFSNSSQTFEGIHLGKYNNKERVIEPKGVETSPVDISKEKEKKNEEGIETVVPEESWFYHNFELENKEQESNCVSNNMCIGIVHIDDYRIAVYHYDSANIHIYNYKNRLRLHLLIYLKRKKREMKKE
eukprot:CAMPEP_0170537468 /NCGR_PEP_ID=MMETSP0209-20121228/102729_1 /TAXON_ID=665100 ORGANISM="Litonotus pictus, Strain P1" /NCGR_SAMPLE_ID=MMETSP0209 /ASSEMBLY_ACC=CAM_ASM_000301 /LENGTH=860 /DNA_ID=CAMNT_0010838971 /DNA_START=1735 /DNA_END=4318 /DNA_ORIENTATION=-